MPNLQPSSNCWRALELIRGLSAVPAIWRPHLGRHFEPFQRAFLIARPEPARRFPCDQCGCAHEVTHVAGQIVGVCACEPWNCRDLILAPGDLQVLELNWPKLARALCQVFGLHPKFTDLRIHNTVQIGSWSAEAVPAVFTIQPDPQSLRSVVCELIARLRERFILLAPTVHPLDALGHEMLAHAGAGFFPLAAQVTLDEEGALHLAGKAPGELFAKFTAQPQAVEEDAARRAFALLQQLDSAPGAEPPSAFTVFRLYCVEELNTREIARICRCSHPTVLNRLKQI